jgi:hypothetical protein
VNVPPDLAEALDRDMEVRRYFDSLSYSKKQRLELPIEEAKKAETASDASTKRSVSCERDESRAEWSALVPKKVVRGNLPRG